MSISRKVSVTRRFTFEASHSLTDYVGPCSNMHGHSYKLFVTVSGNVYTDAEAVNDCMVLDFKELNAIVKKEIVDKFDHTTLNFFYAQPTAEIMAIDFFDKISAVLPKDCTLEKVRLYETEDSYAEVCRN